MDTNFASYFEDIIGYDDIKKELYCILDYLNNKEKYDKYNVSTSNSILLYGEPGLGKTLTSLKFIEASKRYSVIIRKKDNKENFFSYLKEKFEEAKKNAPSIILLDDLDKYAEESKNTKNNEEFSAVQSLIDDVKNKNVFIIATCNEIDNLASSLLRSGRLGQKIYFESPNRDEIKKIMKFYLSKTSLKYGFDIDKISFVLEKFSCADIDACINDALKKCVYEGKEVVETEDILKSVIKLIYGINHGNLKYSKETLLKICYHEAGHCLVGELLEEGSIGFATILKSYSCSSGGFTKYIQNEEYFSDIKYSYNRIKSLLAGKAAVELVYNEIDTGASSDISRASSIIYRLKDEVLNRVFVSYASNDNSASIICNSELELFYNEVKILLSKNRDKLDKLANKLFEKSYIFNFDIREVIENN